MRLAIPRLGHLRLLLAVLPLASCLMDERADWNNPEDPASGVWVPRQVLIIAPGFYPVDSLVLEVGDRLRIHQTYTDDPPESRRPQGRWDFRNLASGATFAIAGNDAYGGIDTILPRGTWMVRSGARNTHGGEYLPDSMVLVVADTGARPRLRLPPDTTFFASSTMVVNGMPGVTLPLVADDPHGRTQSFAYSVLSSGSTDAPQRWTAAIELADVRDFGTYRVLVETMNSVGLWDTGSFEVTVREDVVADDGGETYAIGPFGTQVWMLDNMRSEPGNSGKSWCFGDAPGNCAIYGRLYDWNAATAGQGRNLSGGSGPDFATRIRGICPQGWHLPSFDEVMVLKAWLKRPGVLPGTTAERTLPDELVGRALEARRLWDPFWSDTTWRGSTGFGLLPGGYRDPDADAFRFLGAHGAFWTSSHWASDSARAMAVFENRFYQAVDSTVERSSIAGNLLQIDMDPETGFSVRCLED